MNNNNINGRLLETLLCIPLGAIITILLLNVIITTTKPLMAEYENIQAEQTEQLDYLDEILETMEE